MERVDIRIMDFVDSVVTWLFRNFVLARFLSFPPDQLTEKRDQEFIYWMEMDKKRKKHCNSTMVDTGSMY